MESRIAAPEYLNRQHRPEQLPPGHAFFMYFQGTMTRGEADARGRAIQSAKVNRDKKYTDTHKQREPWAYDPEGERDGLASAVEASKSTIASTLAEAVTARQSALANGLAIESFPFTLTSTLATGTGIEHPLENGFAFLWPYGLPYLAGSGVKGAVRRAAEMLASGEADPLLPSRPGLPRWSWPAVWWLFGFDATTAGLNKIQLDPTAVDLLESWLGLRAPVQKAEQGRTPKSWPDFQTMLQDRDGRGRVHARGALEFWDLIPRGEMSADIMAPHAATYYEGKGSPAECDSPNPIKFIVLKKGASLTFHVSCSERALNQTLREQWRPLLRQAFDLIAAWLGVGAKTAVGYGALGPASAAVTPRPQAPQRAATAIGPAAPAPAAAPAAGPGREARELLTRVNGTKIENIGGQVADWPKLLDALGPADRAVVRQAMVNKLRRWRRDSKKHFERRAQSLPWLSEWAGPAE